MSLRLVVLGATGLVGRTMLELVDARGWTVARPRLLASERAPGRTAAFRGEALPIEPVHEAAFAGAALVLFAGGNDVSRRWAPVARAAGAVVIDNSSAFRYDDDVPLVVPEINEAALAPRPTLIANPNCSTIGIVMALAPLMARRRLLRVWTATYQSASGAGAEALEALERGAREALAAPGAAPSGAEPLAFNVIPRIDRFESNGATREEMKIVWESRKILGLPDLPVSSTAVRVPVRVGHAAAVTAWFDLPLAPEEARRAWAAFPGVRVADAPDEGLYPTPLAAAGLDDVLVGRARVDTGDPSALAFFVASDNLRKGAALNAVQIGEAWLRRFAGAPSGVP
jgi:aspartate-semialdehyde dehydrogenase